MPKIYNKPEEKQELESERHRVTGETGQGGLRTQNRGTMLAIAIILAVVILFLVYRMARGEDLQGAGFEPTYSSIVSVISQQDL